MKLKPFVLSTALAVVWVFAMPATPASAQEDGDAVLVVGDIGCRDLLLQLGAEQDRTISFLHGYSAGSAGRSEVDTQALTLATSRLLEACIEDPDASALTILQDILDDET